MLSDTPNRLDKCYASSRVMENRQSAKSRAARTPDAPATGEGTKPALPNIITPVFAKKATTPTKAVMPPSALLPRLNLSKPNTMAAKPRRIFAAL